MPAHPDEMSRALDMVHQLAARATRAVRQASTGANADEELRRAAALLDDIEAIGRHKFNVLPRRE